MKSKVLIVDDVAVNRHLLRKIVEIEGLEVVEADSGEACLEFCENELPMLILLDVRLPGISGYDVCERLRRYYTKQELPIIMVTDSSEPEDVGCAFAVGVNDHVSKPVNRTVLLARVTNQLAVSQAQKELEMQRAKIARSLEIQRAMGDQLPEAIAIEDKDGALFYSNKQFAEFCGGTTPHDITVAFEYLLGGIFREELINIWSDIQEEREKHVEREVEVYDTSRKVIHLISHHIQNREGEQLRLWVIRDLTKTKELEDAVTHRVKFDTLGTFSAGVAHNFNNILSGILGATELLRRINPSSDKNDRYFKLIQHSVEGGKDLTRRLASMVRKNIRAEGERCAEISDCIDTVIECFREVTGDRITYSTAVDSGLPTINLTEKNFIDVLANLLSNSVDAIKESGSIDVAVHLDDAERCVLVTVKDTGAGMTPDILNRIFEPFYSTKNLDTRNGVSCQGNGLGLWTVYNLIKGAQGDVQVASTAGSGSVVTVSVPLVSPDEHRSFTAMIAPGTSA